MILRLAICTFLLAFAPLAAGQGTSPPPAAPASGVVLLRNGQVLCGRAVAVGETYTIELEAGGTLCVPAAQVDVVCRDLTEAYRIKVARLPIPPSAALRLDLADWCLSHDLHSAAAEQVLAAQAAEPDHPRLAAMERKILARLAEIRAQAERPAAAPSAVEEMEEPLAIAISPRAMETFSSSVQPMLLNRCGTANCHGPAATSSFQLTRSPWGNIQPRRFTQKNLNAVLKLVDRENPQESKIVKLPMQPHGTAKQPLFGDRDAAGWKLLVGWIEQLHAPPEAGRPAKIQRPSDLSLRAAGAPSLWMPIAGEEEAGAAPLPALGGNDGAVAVDPRALRRSDKDMSHPLEPHKPVAPGDRLKSPPRTPAAHPPRDPFDPAIFNKLHHATP